MTDWNEVGDRAFNAYFNTIRKTDDHLEADDAFDSEILEKMEDAGIHIDYSWEFSLPPDAVSTIVTRVVKRAKEHEGAEFVGALHTYITNKFYDAEEELGEEVVSRWYKILNEL